MTLGIFSLMTSELLPVGLLTPLAACLQVSAGSPGLTVTVPGPPAAISAPLTIVVAGGWARRLVLCVLIALIGHANLASVIAPSYQPRARSPDKDLVGVPPPDVRRKNMFEVRPLSGKAP